MFHSALRLLLLSALLLSLFGCAELDTLRVRTAEQEKVIKRLRQENAEFQAAYYKIKEQMDSEHKQSQRSVTELQRGLDEAKTLKSKQEKELSDQLRTRQLEFEALRGEATEYKTQSEAKMGQLGRDLQAMTAERDAALARIQDLDAKLRAEQANSAELTRQVAQLKVDVKTLADRGAALEKDLAARTQTLGERDAALAAEKDARGKAEAQLAALNKQLTDQQAALAQSQEASAKLKKDLDAAAATAAELDKARKEREALAGQVESLKSENAKSLEQAKAAAARRAEASPADDADLAAAAAALRQKLAAIPEAKGASVRLDGRGLRVIIPNAALFGEKEVALADRAAGVLAPVAAALKTLPGRPVRIEGHTDNEPIKDLPFKDNWALGYARADRVREFLMTDGGVPGSQLTALSRAQFDPVAGNDTAEGRAQNRRIEIVIGAKGKG